MHKLIKVLTLKKANNTIKFIHIKEYIPTYINEFINGKFSRDENAITLSSSPSIYRGFVLRYGSLNEAGNEYLRDTTTNVHISIKDMSFESDCR